MKKIIIYTTKDEVISLHLVKKIVTNEFFNNYQIDIILSRPSFLRKIKIFIVILFFGSIKDFFKQLKKKVDIEEILSNKNCNLVEKVEKNYDFGLSVYCSSKITVEKFKIYNFHLGSLEFQRGSFIFFYKFIKNWDNINLTFHEISERFDVGKIINEREIILARNCKASDILLIYLKNLDFLMQSIKKIDSLERKEYKNFTKLNLVPSFYKLIKEIIFFFIKRFNNH